MYVPNLLDQGHCRMPRGVSGQMHRLAAALAAARAAARAAAGPGTACSGQKSPPHSVEWSGLTWARGCA